MTRLPTLNHRVPATMRPILTWTVMGSDSYRLNLYGLLMLWVFSNGKFWRGQVCNTAGEVLMYRDWQTEKQAKVAAEIDAAKVFKDRLKRMQSFVRRRAARGK